ncbi:MAG: hypothetical protein HON04_09635, partial [Planctomicrobium sp.]|nr:hypothetical protein [Planctomicrobium sp.]
MSFVILTMLFFLIWARVAPELFPEVFKIPKAKAVAEGKDNVDEDAILNPDKGEEGDEVKVTLSDGNATEENPEVVVEPEPEMKLDEFQNKEILLGQAGFEAGYLLQAKLNTRGASVDWVQLTDPRYKTLNRKEQLKVVGNPIQVDADQRTPNTFEISIPQINSQLEKYETTLAEVDWEIVKQDLDSVTFRYPSPAGDLEVLKTYRLEKGDPELVDDSPQGYLLDVEIAIRNTSTKTIETAYVLQGPVGMPLENIDNTRS